MLLRDTLVATLLRRTEIFDALMLLQLVLQFLQLLFEMLLVMYLRRLPPPTPSGLRT